MDFKKGEKLFLDTSTYLVEVEYHSYACPLESYVLWEETKRRVANRRLSRTKPKKYEDNPSLALPAGTTHI